MDILTHMAAGSLVAQAAAPEEHRWAFALVGAGAGVVADIDFLARKASDRLLFLKLHRGFSHSLVSCLLVGVCAGASGMLLFSAPFWPLFGASVAAAISHLLLDASVHARGIQALWPWRRKVSLHLVLGLNPLTTSARCWERSLVVCLRCSLHSALLSPLVLLTWAGLAVTLLAPAGWWRPACAVTAGLVVLYLLVCRALRARASAAFSRRLSGEAGPATGRARLFPGSFDPRVWIGIVPSRRGFSIHRIGPGTGDIALIAEHGPSDEEGDARLTLADPIVEAFRENAVIPHATSCRTDGRRLVIWRDLSFSLSPHVTLFAARIELDAEARVTRGEFQERWERAPEIAC